MPSFPRCQEHGIRACPCEHPGVQYPGDLGAIDEALAEARAHVRKLEQFRAQVAHRPPPRAKRELTLAEKQGMRNFPAWALDAPVSVDASIPVGSIVDFNDLV